MCDYIVGCSYVSLSLASISQIDQIKLIVFSSTRTGRSFKTVALRYTLYNTFTHSAATVLTLDVWLQAKLIFDSKVFLEEFNFMKATGRKRSNKSSRCREKKKLKSSSLSSIAVDTMLYDRVLVDSECSHDGSYRRLAAMSKSHPQTTS